MKKIKNLVLSGDNMITVYPLQNVLQLALLGLPCLILGILSLSESAETKMGMDLLLVLYSSIMLVFFCIHYRSRRQNKCHDGSENAGCRSTGQYEYGQQLFWIYSVSDQSVPGDAADSGGGQSGAKNA